MSGSSPVIDRICLPNRRHSFSSWVLAIGPELVALGLAVDDVLDSQPVEQFDPLG